MTPRDGRLDSGALLRTAVCSGVLGVASAFGDWLWAGFIPDGAVLPGVVHGVLAFALMAVLLGWATPAASSKRLLLALPPSGFAIAAAFYPLAYVLGYLGSLLVTWLAMWAVMAFLLRWAQQFGPRESLGVTLGRIAGSAIGSGLAFWAISGIWTSPTLDPNYVLRSLQWAFAFFPGFLCLLWRRSS